MDHPVHLYLTQRQQDGRRLAPSNVKVKRGAGEDLKVKEGAPRSRVDRQQIEADTGCGQLADCHAVERVNLGVAEVLRRDGDSLREASRHARHRHETRRTCQSTMSTLLAIIIIIIINQHQYNDIYNRCLHPPPPP